MGKVDVVCGVVIHNNEILICQKGDGPSKDKWEFPGGKINPGESREDSIVRELFEELELRVLPRNEIVSYNFGNYNLIFIECSCSEPFEIKLKEHQDYKWCSIPSLKYFNFVDGDIEFIKVLDQNSLNGLDSHDNKDMIKRG
jgi:8-oxo-dGTP diphosphatase